MIKAILLVLLALQVVAVPHEAVNMNFGNLLNNNCPPKGPAPSVVDRVNSRGPYVALMVPNTETLAHVKGYFAVDEDLIPETIPKGIVDRGGRRFWIGQVDGIRAILVLSGSGTENTALTTQMLIDHFAIKAIVNIGHGGSTTANVGLGDVVIPVEWAKHDNWVWQQEGEGPSFILPEEERGFYTRSDPNFRFLVGGSRGNQWHQPVDLLVEGGSKEIAILTRWVSVSRNLYEVISESRVAPMLDNCVDMANRISCVAQMPSVKMNVRGVSGSIFVDNFSYQEYLGLAYGAAFADTESAAGLLVAYTNNVPFVAIRGVSHDSGQRRPSAVPKNAAVYLSLAIRNAWRTARALLPRFAVFNPTPQ